MELPQTVKTYPDAETVRSLAATLCAAARVALRHSGGLDEGRRAQLLSQVETTAERLRMAFP